jgi:hypothetical protein
MGRGTLAPGELKKLLTIQINSFLMLVKETSRILGKV